MSDLNWVVPGSCWTFQTLNQATQLKIPVHQGFQAALMALVVILIVVKPSAQVCPRLTIFVFMASIIGRKKKNRVYKASNIHKASVIQPCHKFCWPLQSRPSESEIQMYKGCHLSSATWTSFCEPKTPTEWIASTDQLMKQHAGDIELQCSSCYYLKCMLWFSKSAAKKAGNEKW